MTTLTKQLVNEDGFDVPPDEQCWHVITHASGDLCLLCTGEFVDEGARNPDAVYRFKEVNRGGITCKNCLSHVKEMKAIKL